MLIMSLWAKKRCYLLASCLKGENWNLNGKDLIPAGDVEKKLNDRCQGGAMNTYGVDMAFDLNNDLTYSVGYYY